MQVQSTNNYSSRQLSFEGKFNVRQKYFFDTDLIENFVASDNGVLLNLKERILHSNPSESEMNKFRYTCKNIIEQNSVTHMPKKYNSAGHPEGWNNYDHISEHEVLSTPERADSILKLYEDEFWSKYGVKQLKINMPFNSFVNTYETAIQPANATKIFNLP